MKNFIREQLLYIVGQQIEEDQHEFAFSVHDLFAVGEELKIFYFD